MINLLFGEECDKKKRRETQIKYKGLTLVDGIFKYCPWAGSGLAAGSPLDPLLTVEYMPAVYLVVRDRNDITFFLEYTYFKIFKNVPAGICLIFFPREIQ